MFIPDFLIIALVDAALVAAQSCTFTLQDDLNPKKEPLLFKEANMDISDEESQEVKPWDIVYPSVFGRKGVINVSDKEQLMIACPGKGNTVVGNGKEQAHLTCDRGKFTMDGQEANVKSTSCSKSYAKSLMQETDEACGTGADTGVIFEIGFLIDNNNSWFPMIEICHNITRGVTLYASHTIEGQSIKGAEKCSDRKGFAKGLKKLYPGIDVDKVFTKQGQESAFRRILGPTKYADYINDNTIFLARGHLAPDSDFIYAIHQMMTYYFANAAPQWQTFNAGNWLTLENAVRDLAAKVGTIQVTTGTAGVLELIDSTNHKRPMYLAVDEKMVPVPKVFWKMVQHPITKACTIAVGHNNVFFKRKPTPICPSKNPDGWPVLDDIAKGFTYYCDYQGFVAAVPFAPDIDCEDLFEFPQAQS